MSRDTTPGVRVQPGNMEPMSSIDASSRMPGTATDTNGDPMEKSTKPARTLYGPDETFRATINPSKEATETSKEATSSSTELDTEAQPTSPSSIPYSIYSKPEKWLLVSMVALAGFFSPLPANIYFPAIPLLSRTFHKSIDALNQTVTVYLVMQGLSPMLWGPLSDRYGRRVVFLMCLGVLIGSSVGLALCPTDAFWLLLLLRCFQSGGGASAIALGAGVIGDIAEPKERGGYFGFFNLGPQLAPCIGPVVGGALAEGLGWRAIFWFLSIMASLCLLIVALFLPETLRSLVGNGSVPAKGFSKEVIPIVGRKVVKQPVPDAEEGAAPQKKQSVNPWTLFLLPDFVLLLSFTGIIYAVNYSITATISSSFAVVYPFLSETALGLCYLSTGGGMILGSTFTGKLLDWEYKRAKARVRDDEVFCIEHARLRTMPAHLAVFVALTLGWGWSLQTGVSIAVPLVLQFWLGWTSIAILNTTMTLNIDILQTRSSGATACTNLVRCSLGAILISVINRITERLGFGWAYVLLGGICALQLPLMLLEMRKGPTWRMRRDPQVIE